MIIRSIVQEEDGFWGFVYDWSPLRAPWEKRKKGSQMFLQYTLTLHRSKIEFFGKLFASFWNIILIFFMFF